MLPYESRLNQNPHRLPATDAVPPPARSLNAFAANRLMEATPPPRHTARRLADAYSAAVGSGGFSSPSQAAAAVAPRTLSPLQKAHMGATNAAMRHHIGGRLRDVARLSTGAVGTAHTTTGNEPAVSSRPISDPMQTDSSPVTRPMVAAQTPEITGGPRGAVIGRSTTAQDDIARATQAARALQSVLSDRRLRQFRSTRQAIAGEFSRAMGAHANQHSQTSTAQENHALEQARQAHDGQQANANRRQQAAQFNAQQFGQEQMARRALSNQTDQPWQMSQTADGTPGIIRSSGRFTPITGQDGQPVHLAQPKQGLSQETLFKAFTEQENAIRNGLATPEEKHAQLVQLHRSPLYQPLLRQFAPTDDAQLTPDGQWVRQLPDGRWQAYGDGQ